MSICPTSDTRSRDSGSSHARTYALLVTAMVFYGMSFISTKIVLAFLGPIAILLVRITISALLLTLVDLARSSRVPIRRADLKWFLLVALFQPVLYFLAENFGLQFVSASAASIVIGTIPVVTPVIAAPILRERLSAVNMAGLVVSLLGVALIVIEGRARPDIDPAGIALLFVAVLAAAGYAVAVRAVPRRYDVLTIVRMQNLLGIVIVLPLFLVLERGTVPYAMPAATVIGHLGFLALFPSTLSFLFLSAGIRAVGASRANAFANLVPVFTALFSFLMLGELVTLPTLAGMAIVITGVTLAQSGTRGRVGGRLGA